MNKQKLYSFCIDLLNTKIEVHQRTLNELKESASNESKSTAGDKHETALAMLQIEQKNTAVQMDHLLLQKKSLERIYPLGRHTEVINGSLIKTDKGYFYLSIPLGKIEFEGEKIIALSMESPLGSKFPGHKPGETAVFNNMNYLIVDLF